MASNDKFSEEYLQSLCYQWFHNTYPALRGLLFHIPNGGNRSVREGAKFKAMGVVPGVPDLLLCVPCGMAWHALFIEMKAQGGKLSPAQVKEQPRLRSAGYAVETIDSIDAFKALVSNWVAHTHHSIAIDGR
jgi:hypothetical protein